MRTRVRVLQTGRASRGCRATLDLSSADRIEFVWLGSHDRLASGFSTSSGAALLPDGAIGTETEMAFMRGELRLVHDTSDLVIGVAMRLGWERSAYVQFGAPGLSVEAFTLGPRMWLTARPLTQVVVRAGAQMIGALGQLDARQETPELGIGTGEIFSSQYGRARRRSVSSVYGELTWEPIRELRVDLGVRGDLWITGRALEASADPRLRVSVRPIREFALHVGGAVARQPAVLAIPLPGLAELSEVLGELAHGSLHGLAAGGYLDATLHTVADIEVGEVLAAHTCAMGLAAVACWGSGEAGQLGHGRFEDSSRPVLVSDLPAPATALSLGGLHSCALLDDGRVACWGDNSHGQLGVDPSELPRSATPIVLPWIAGHEQP